MNVTDILNGSSSFQARGYAKTVLLNQTAFDLRRSVFQTEVDDNPVFDADVVNALGDNGLTKPVKLDTNELTEGMAAAFILVTRHIHTPDPETGRRPEYLLRIKDKEGVPLLKDPKTAIQVGVNWRLQQREQQARATAEALSADPTKRLETIKAETAAQAALIIDPVQKHFVACLAKFKEEDDDTLIDIALEAMVNAGRDPVKECKRSAQAFIDAAKKRYERGEYVSIDAGIYAMAQM